MDDVVTPGFDDLQKVPFRVMPDEPVAEIRDAQLHTRGPALLDGDALRQVTRLVDVVAQQVRHPVGEQLQGYDRHHRL